MAEWSKAPDLGSGLSRRGFEPHLRQTRFQPIFGYIINWKFTCSKIKKFSQIKLSIRYIFYVNKYTIFIYKLQIKNYYFIVYLFKILKILV